LYALATIRRKKKKEEKRKRQQSRSCRNSGFPRVLLPEEKRVWIEEMGHPTRFLGPDPMRPLGLV